MNNNKPTAIIFDMDGTLANVSAIRHYLRPTPTHRGKNFDAFHAASVDCPPNAAVVSHAMVAHLLGHAIIIVTARKAMWRDHTAWWLAMHGVPSDAMFMRGNKDSRPDYLVKKDILDAMLHTWDVVHAVDDNPSVIALWQEHGIPTTIVEGWEDL
jgi:phosphoglycolate phosphatase-like HAD superfamily hydrolase